VKTDNNIKSVVLVSIAAQAGSSVGNELGAFVRNQLEARRRREQGLPEVEKRIYLQTLGSNGVATTTVVATALALRAERRRPLWGFVIAVVLTALIGDRFDRLLMPKVPGG
jgi:hypothetical protein